MPRGSFGERVQAMTGYLGGRFGISQRVMVLMFEMIFHLEIGLGSILAEEERVSQALKQPVDSALEYARQQTAKNMDETSWHELTKTVLAVGLRHARGDRLPDFQNPRRQRGAGVAWRKPGWDLRIRPLQRL